MQVLDVTDLTGRPPEPAGEQSPPAAGRGRDRPGAEQPGRRPARPGSAPDRRLAHRPFPGGAPDLRRARCHGRQCGQYRLRAPGPAASKHITGGRVHPAHPLQPGRPPPGARALHHPAAEAWLSTISRAEEVRDGIIAAWAFAAADPYRAATHNKGIMNGVDAVVHRHRQRLARRRSRRACLCRPLAGATPACPPGARTQQGNLVGTLEMPMAVGIVGGATRVHPAARAALKLMGVKTAAELAEIIVSVGLAQNLAALRALATEGIQRGHMSLHARQVAIAAGAAGDQIERVAQQLVAEKAVRIDRAEEILKDNKKRTKPQMTQMNTDKKLRLTVSCFLNRL